ncbi:MAG TPA: helix-turn-helix transcriptional regulator [Pseudonocardiaceae bacterium]|jgi:hypothetical protein
MPGRRPQPVDPDETPEALLAWKLRTLRNSNGDPAKLDDIAAETGIGRSTLYKAVQGRGGVPTAATVSALVRAWGGDEAEWELHRDATMAQVEGFRFQRAAFDREAALEQAELDAIPVAEFWGMVLARAGELAAWSIVESAGAESWDFRATRGIIAIALYIVARSNEVPATQVPVGDLLPTLILAEKAFEKHAATALSLCGHHLVEGARQDPVAAQWDWLVKEWDPHAPAGYRWDGLPRAIARGTRRPAVDICLSSARAAVSLALIAEREALAPRTRVRVTGGDFAGKVLRLEHPAWRCVPSGKSIVDGPPSEYMVNLGTKHDFRCEAIPAADLAVLHD